MVNSNHECIVDPKSDLKWIRDKLMFYSDLFLLRKEIETADWGNDHARIQERYANDQQKTDQLAESEAWGELLRMCWKGQSRIDVCHHIMALSIQHQYTRETCQTAIMILDQAHARYGAQQKNPTLPEEQKEDLNNGPLYVASSFALRLAVKLKTQSSATHDESLHARNPYDHPSKDVSFVSTNGKKRKAGVPCPPEYKALELPKRGMYERLLMDSLQVNLQCRTPLWWFQQCLYHSLAQLGNNKDDGESSRFKLELLQKQFVVASAQHLDWWMVHRPDYRAPSIAALVFYEMWCQRYEKTSSWHDLFCTVMTSVTGRPFAWVVSHLRQSNAALQQVEWYRMWKVDTMEQFQRKHRMFDNDHLQHDFHIQCPYDLSLAHVVPIPFPRVSKLWS